MPDQPTDVRLAAAFAALLQALCATALQGKVDTFAAMLRRAIEAKQHSADLSGATRAPN